MWVGASGMACPVLLCLCWVEKTFNKFEKFPLKRNSISRIDIYSKINRHYLRSQSQIAGYRFATPPQLPPSQQTNIIFWIWFIRHIRGMWGWDRSIVTGQTWLCTDKWYYMYRYYASIYRDRIMANKSIGNAFLTRRPLPPHKIGEFILGHKRDTIRDKTESDPYKCLHNIHVWLKETRN